MSVETLNPNRIVKCLGKAPEEFTKRDLIKFIEKNDICMLNFRSIGGDGKLKTLNFVINSKRHLDRVLSSGERVDGSNLFSYIQADSSDLYVIPRYRTAFVNPFAKYPTLDILCSYYTREGEPLNSSPETVVKKAHKVLKERTGMSFEVLGELEYYIYSELDHIYPITPQKGYHSSHPFSKWEFIRLEAMKIISEIGGQIKYGHSEVGNIISGSNEYVQHEIEFLPCPVEDMADQLVVAKWVLREVAYKHGVELSFAPKIMVGQAGSGLHIHSRLVKDGTNMIADKEGLNETAKKMIGGYLRLAPSLAAFGNTVPTSYLRLAPHQEAPTCVCWGEFNRSALIRVPLGWIGAEYMIHDANPQEREEGQLRGNNQTIELRSPDGSANIHQLLAGMTVAARYGLEWENALKLTEELHIDPKKTQDRQYPHLPLSCYEAAQTLLKDREVYQSYEVFPERMIDGIVKEMMDYQDKDYSEKMFGNGDALITEVKKYLHCG